MKTFIKLSAAAALLAATAAPAMAAGVLTVDFGRVLSDSAAAKSGNTQIHAKYDSLVQQRNTAFTTAAQSYQTQVAAVQAIKAPAQPTQAQLTAARQAADRAQAAQDALNQVEQEAQTVGRYVQQQIVEKVAGISEQIRAERKADIVVPKGSVLAADPAGDVTTLVIQRLDSTFPNPSITLPQQAAPAANPGR